MDIASGRQDRLTFDRSFETAAWAPDGKSLVLVSTTRDLYTVAADGSSVPAKIADTAGRDASSAAPHWTAGAGIVFTTGPEAQTDLWSIRPGVDTAAAPLVATDMREDWGSVSPDGQWILFQAASAISGNGFARPARAGVVVRPFANPMASLRQVAETGLRPIWSHDGREIFYRSFSGGVVAVAVLSGPGFAVGPGHVLFTQQGLSAFDVTPDGRFILLRTRGADTQRHLIMVEHFDSELKDKWPR